MSRRKVSAIYALRAMSRTAFPLPSPLSWRGATQSAACPTPALALNTLPLNFNAGTKPGFSTTALNERCSWQETSLQLS
jgi:hypothetical protein